MVDGAFGKSQVDIPYSPMDPKASSHGMGFGRSKTEWFPDLLKWAFTSIV